MRCSNCGADADKNWEFCPHCGAKIKKRMFADVFSFGMEDIFGHLGKEVERMQKEMTRNFDKNFEVLDLRPMFEEKKPGARGFTIKIVKRSDKNPKVDIKTFGGVNKHQIEEEVSKKLGVRPTPGKKLVQKRKIPKVTEEPKTNIKQLPGKALVEIELPGVKSLHDIEIDELKRSAEIKAYTKDKMYFKIIQLPPNLRISQKDFKNGKLTLEFGY